jgi:1-acyl-sn-glycerol-3-phosphate acyltransferase
MSTPEYRGAGPSQDRLRALLAPVARRLWRIHLEGFERLPASGPAILCPNHISFMDSAFLMLNVPRRISFVGKAEYMGSWKTKYFFPFMGMIPIDRSGGERSRAALDAAASVLRRGELFGIYPEGTRSRDGYLYRARTGAARLAIDVGCSIYPVGIVGTAEIQPPDARVPKPFRSCSLRIGPPIDPSKYPDVASEPGVLRAISDDIMRSIQSLTGQEYRDVYAGTADDAGAIDSGGPEASQ